MFKHKKIERYLVFLIAVSFCNQSYSANNDYIFPYSTISHSNYGGGGLIMNPSARFNESGTLALKWTNFDPYIRGAILAYPFDWLEAAYQYTDVNNALYSDIEAFSGDQTYKDKGFDVKFKIMQERDWRPSIALGVRDIAGTGVFSSEYIVLSKYLGNLDFTFGLGWGNLSNNGKYSNPLGKVKSSMYARGVMDSSTQGGEVSYDSFFTGDMGIFGGVEYFLPNMRGARLKLEYSGIDYRQEGFPTKDSFSFAFEDVRKPQSNINISLDYPINDYFRIDAAFVKGNTFTVGLTIALPLRKKNVLNKKKTDQPIKVPNPIERKIVAAKSDENLYNLALKHLNERKVYLQGATKVGSTLEVIYAQNTFPSFALSAGRVARVLDEISPDSITDFKISNINGGIGMHTIELNRKSFKKYEEKKFTKLLKKNSKIIPYKNTEDQSIFNPTIGFPKTFWSVSPDLRSQIGGPDGFFFGDIRLKLKAETLFAKNISFLVNASVGIYDSFDALNENPDSVLPPVRTNVIPYLKESRKASIQRMQLNYFVSPGTNLYGKLSAGLFEDMFGGIGGEILYKPFYKNYAIGAELWRVQQRDFDMRFAFRDYKTTTGHINIYYHEPISNIILRIKGGKFLARDSGFNFDFSRRFESGMRVGAYFALTDISKEEFGEGSFDKGFYFHVPLDLFLSGYTKRKIPWGLRPLTRDGAAYLVHGQSIWGITEQASNHAVSRSWNEIYE